MLYLGIADHGRQGMDALQLPDLWGCTSGYAFLGRGKTEGQVSLVSMPVYYPFEKVHRAYRRPTLGRHLSGRDQSRAMCDENGTLTKKDQNALFAIFSQRILFPLKLSSSYSPMA